VEPRSISGGIRLPATLYGKPCAAPALSVVPDEKKGPHPLSRQRPAPHHELAEELEQVANSCAAEVAEELEKLRHQSCK
jgi:hypothetical protein